VTINQTPAFPPPQSASIGRAPAYDQMVKEVRMWAIGQAVELCDTDTNSTMIINVARKFYDYVMTGTG